MEDQLISLETAKLAKEKGFNISCDKAYYQHGTDTNFKPLLLWKESEAGEPKFGEAPTQSLLQKWLREKHNIFCYVEVDETTEPKFVYYISRFIGNKYDLASSTWYWKQDGTSEYLYRTYEEALEVGLQAALKLI